MDWKVKVKAEKSGATFFSAATATDFCEQVLTFPAESEGGGGDNPSSGSSTVDTMANPIDGVKEEHQKCDFELPPAAEEAEGAMQGSAMLLPVKKEVDWDAGGGRSAADEEREEEEEEQAEVKQEGEQGDSSSPYAGRKLLPVKEEEDWGASAKMAASAVAEEQEEEEEGEERDTVAAEREVKQEGEKDDVPAQQIPKQENGKKRAVTQEEEEEEQNDQLEDYQPQMQEQGIVKEEQADRAIAEEFYQEEYAFQDQYAYCGQGEDELGYEGVDYANYAEYQLLEADQEEGDQHAELVHHDGAPEGDTEEPMFEYSFGEGEEAQEEEEQEGEEREDEQEHDENETLENEEEGDENEHKTTTRSDKEKDGEEEKHQDQPEPPKGSEVFVGGVPRSADEAELKKLFGNIGELYSVRLMRDPKTKESKGFAFVRFTTPQNAELAVQKLHGHILMGRKIGVMISNDNQTLFLGHINKDWQKKQLEEFILEAGIKGVTEITLMMDPVNENRNRGFAFLEFQNHHMAAKAHGKMSRPDFKLGKMAVNIDWAQPLNDPGVEVMAQVKSVYVCNLPLYVDDDLIKQLFGEYGEIERIVLSKNLQSARRNDFAFVNYTDRSSALKAIEERNGHVVQGKQLSVTLAKPVLERKNEPRPKAGRLSKSATTIAIPPAMLTIPSALPVAAAGAGGMPPPSGPPLVMSDPLRRRGSGPPRRAPPISVGTAPLLLRPISAGRVPGGGPAARMALPPGVISRGGRGLVAIRGKMPLRARGGVSARGGRGAPFLQRPPQLVSGSALPELYITISQTPPSPSWIGGGGRGGNGSYAQAGRRGGSRVRGGGAPAGGNPSHRKGIDPVSSAGTGSGSSSAFKCDVCNVTLNSESQLQQHLQGKQHMRAVNPEMADQATPTVSAVEGEVHKGSHTQQAATQTPASPVEQNIPSGSPMIPQSPPAMGSNAEGGRKRPNINNAQNFQRNPRPRLEDGRLTNWNRGNKGDSRKHIPPRVMGAPTVGNFVAPTIPALHHHHNVPPIRGGGTARGGRGRGRDIRHDLPIVVGGGGHWGAKGGPVSQQKPPYHVSTAGPLPHASPPPLPAHQPFQGQSSCPQNLVRAHTPLSQTQPHPPPPSAPPHPPQPMPPAPVYPSPAYPQTPSYQSPTVHPPTHYQPSSQPYPHVYPVSYPQPQPYAPPQQQQWGGYSHPVSSSPSVGSPAPYSPYPPQQSFPGRLPNVPQAQHTSAYASYSTPTSSHYYQYPSYPQPHYGAIPHQQPPPPGPSGSSAPLSRSNQRWQA
ncbi:Polyadenylate-binding protein 5 [Balamuthia mandrillaris]